MEKNQCIWGIFIDNLSAGWRSGGTRCNKQRQYENCKTRNGTNSEFPAGSEVIPDSQPDRFSAEMSAAPVDGNGGAIDRARQI